MAEKDSTHFGFEQVASGEKQDRVRQVFDSVADRYDVMNDLMSMGIHRLWKRQAIELAGIKRGQRVLDLASGTADLATRFATLVGPDGLVIVSDINAAMLSNGRDRMLDDGHAGNVDYAQINAENLPFPDNSFDCISIAFGLRNVTDKQAELESMFNALRPGGRVLILEFSKPTNALFKSIYDTYSFKILPKIGKLIANDEDSYRYLAESIRMHPDQKTLQDMMEQAGLEHCDYHNMNNGVVAIHRGYKI